MIKTLVALVTSMTVATFLLIGMETAPARPTVPLPLQAVRAATLPPEMALVRQTDADLQYVKWRNIVVHDAGRDGPGILAGCHFVIGSAQNGGDGAIEPTRLWRLQQDGRHVNVPGAQYNTTSIGIAVQCDARQQGLTPQQLAALINLAQALQVTCQIPQDHVYLHADLGGVGCPGRLFPAAALRKGLLPACR